MLRHDFDQKQRRLADEVLVLGGHVEEALKASVEVFKRQNPQTALDLIANNRNLNRKCASIETQTLVLLATQQPMARDLRMLASILEVALELKRIGLHAKEIAGVKLRIENGIDLPAFSKIDHMAYLSGAMLNQALKAFATQDIELAQSVPHRDDEVDHLYQEIHRKLLTTIEGDQSMVGTIMYLFQVGHHLERVADRATNICEWVVFAVTGTMKELNTDLVT